MNRGGAETMVMNYYRHMDRTKVQFDFLVHRQEQGAYDDEIDALGGRIYRTMPLYPLNFLKYKKWVGEFLNEHNEYQIVHSHMSESGYFFFKEAKKRGVQVLICHAHNAAKGWNMKMFVRTYFKYQIRKYCTYMFSCGMEAGEWLFGKKNTDKLIIQHNAISAKDYSYCPEVREKIRKDLNLKERFTIGLVARFSYQKNHMFLLDVFEAILNEHSDGMLLLVGSGELKEKIEEEIQRRSMRDAVIMTGLRTDIPDLLQAMDAFVMPSHFEGLSVAIVEAQAAGLPCFISDKVPIECKLTDLVQQIPLSQEPKVWAKAILDAKEIKRRDTYNEIVAAKFDIKENAKWMQDFYMESIGVLVHD
ncbi:glycosyltransferase family 1 protein [Murimonas intestini]|nr:glycosyltransferase family 1 protein [Murimonas intestini]MCR1839602.1 glycosyltransferase family 1 protein [Murimonas intestini]